MKLLLDTHLMLWWMEGDTRITPDIRQLVSQSQQVYFSRASLWEMSIKHSLGRLDVNLPRFCDAVTAGGFEWLDIRQDHLLAVAELAVFEDHRDPFDRLLVAQSLTEPLILLTADTVLARYGSTVRVV